MDTHNTPSQQQGPPGTHNKNPITRNTAPPTSQQEITSLFPKLMTTGTTATLPSITHERGGATGGNNTGPL